MRFHDSIRKRFCCFTKNLYVSIQGKNFHTFIYNLFLINCKNKSTQSLRFDQRETINFKLYNGKIVNTVPQKTLTEYKILTGFAILEKSIKENSANCNC